MRRGILVLAVLLWSALAAFGNANVKVLQPRGWIGNADYVSAVACMPDTINATDSIVIYVGEERVNRQLIVAWDSLKGTGNDSVDFTIEIAALGPAGTVLNRLTDTTVTWNTPFECILPLGTLLIGSTYRVTLKQAAGAGTQLVFTHMYLYERKAKY